VLFTIFLNFVRCQLSVVSCSEVGGRACRGAGRRSGLGTDFACGITVLASDTQEIAPGLVVLGETGDLRSHPGRGLETRAQRRDTRRAGGTQRQKKVLGECPDCLGWLILDVRFRATATEDGAGFGGLPRPLWERRLDTRGPKITNEPNFGQVAGFAQLGIGNWDWIDKCPVWAFDNVDGFYERTRFWRGARTRGTARKRFAG
jgi:hypothetical protein